MRCLLAGIIRKRQPPNDEKRNGPLTLGEKSQMWRCPKGALYRRTGREAAFLLLIIALAMWQPHLPLATADPVTSAVTLYAHTDPSADTVLTLRAPNATSKHAPADVRDGLTFTLASALCAPLHVMGTISVYVYLASQGRVRGTLEVTIAEVTANSSVMEIERGSVTIDRYIWPYLVIFGLGPANHTFGAGSAVSLSVQVSPVPSVAVSLLWDDPSAATRLILDVEEPLKRILRITDVSGRDWGTVFPENSTGMTRLIVDATVEDSFRGVNIWNVSLSVTNSSGYTLIDALMNPIGSESPSRFHYRLAIDLASDKLSIALHAQDVAGTTFTTRRQVTICQFYAVVLILVDLQRKPLRGLNVSFWVSDQLIGQVTTNSTGTAAVRLPSYKSVGPVTIRVRKDEIEFQSYPSEVSVDSDARAKIVVALSDWNLRVRLEMWILVLPFPNGRVDTYYDGSFFASNKTDWSGVAFFTDAPYGAYEIAVNSSLASSPFQKNVTRPNGEKETIVDIPILYVIEHPGPGAFVLVGVAVVAIVIFALARRRERMRTFEHVAELIGGPIPRSALIMIVGASGSGKSLLLRNILADLLQNGRRCVYISNSELPSKIKDRLAKMGVDIQKHQDEKTFRLVDACSGGTGAASPEEHWVASPRDLTALGIQLTSCLEEVGGVGDVFFDSLAPTVGAGDSAQALNFVEYYGARVAKAGGTFLYVAGATIENNLQSQFEEASDCVLETERYVGPGKIRGRLLVKKARGLDHQRDWVGFKIAPNGRMEFVRLPTQRPSEA